MQRNRRVLSKSSRPGTAAPTNRLNGPPTTFHLLRCGVLTEIRPYRERRMASNLALQRTHRRIPEWSSPILYAGTNGDVALTAFTALASICLQSII